MELTSLRNIGLTDGEIRIYEALLELGETTRTALAKKSGISPSKIYDVANRLLEKGIISAVKKQGVLHFSAADPERLKSFLQQKEEALHQERAVVDQLLPTLLLKYQKTAKQTDIEVFYGWEGMQTAYSDIIKSLGVGDCNYVFGASTGHDSAQADRFFSQYNQQKRKKGFATKIIFNEEMRGNHERIHVFTQTPNELRFLHHDTFTEINTYKDTVLFIMLFKNPTVIRIRSREAADSFRKFFATLWHQAKP
ncbi:MAG TPA: helix-turn-helix domain-containing protein [Candidatus Nanoarchaeia archaeon]|nr:helix-turn-helix domain-containing protein [Candidatus Nanoarchaeia archaeon]